MNFFVTFCDYFRFNRTLFTYMYLHHSVECNFWTLLNLLCCKFHFGTRFSDFLHNYGNHMSLKLFHRAPGCGSHCVYYRTNITKHAWWQHQAPWKSVINWFLCLAENFLLGVYMIVPHFVLEQSFNSVVQFKISISVDNCKINVSSYPAAFEPVHSFL